ncbi:MAG: OmpA family protein [Bacteroidales bacterium]
MKFLKINRVNLLLLFFTYSTVFFAQEQMGLRDKADKLFNEFQYAKAAVLYAKLNDTTTPKLKDMERLAFCFYKMNKYTDAEIWYARVIASKESSPENLIKYGEILKANALYPKAKKILKQYGTLSGRPEDVAIAISGCDSAQLWMANPTKYKIRNEVAINTENSEFALFPTSGKAYYAGEPVGDEGDKKYGWTGNSFLRVFTATKAPNSNALSQPELASKDLNREAYHVGPISANRAGDMFFVTRTYPGKKGVLKKDSRGQYLTNNMELFIQPNVYGKWQEPTPFAYNNVKQYSVGHAAISPNGKVLYFVSDMPGGEGGTDIWYCELEPDGSWSPCQNAGSINTKEDELFPTMSADGTLYYSTRGLPGMGGLDIFRVKGSKDEWSKPINMRYPINSAGDDFHFILNDSKTGGYLSSNRKNGRGGDDIYSFTIPKPKVFHFLKATVLNKVTKVKIPDAAVTLTSAGTILAKQSSKVDGTVLFQVDDPTDYNVQAAKESFYADSLNVKIADSEVNDTLKVTLYLDQLFEKGKTIRMENIHYNFDKDDIRADAAIILDKLVETMHENPTLKIELASHTDSRGTVEYNHNLSQRRAQSAVNYLVSKGIERTRMIAHGYGESKLLNKCSDGVECTDDEHQANRRTEFTVLEY